MAYPLANLPYGLRCRFREFATPYEAHNFGIVAPTFLGEKYVQKAVTCDTVTVFLNEKSEPVARIEVSKSLDRTTILNDTDLYVAKKVCLEAVSPQYLANFNFDYYNVYLTRCHFTGEFMQRRWHNINRLYIDNCTFTEDFHMGYLCAVLRPLELVLKDNTINGNWVDMFLVADTDGIRNICIETNSIDVLNIDERTLWELFMVQGIYDFSVDIVIDADESLIAEALSRVFKNDFYLVDMNGYIKNIRFVMRVYCKNGVERKDWWFEMREEESEY